MNAGGKMLSEKAKQSYIASIILGLVVIFIGAIIDTSGRASFCAFVLAICFILFMYKNMNDIIIFSTVVLINNALATGSITLLSTRRIIFFILLCMFIYRVKRIKRKKDYLVSGYYFFAWYIYIFVDDVIFHKTDLASMLTMAMLFLLGYMLQSIVTKNRKNAEKFLIAMIVAFTFIVAISYIELILGHTFFYSKWTGGERYRNGILRTGSTVSDPNNICYMILPLLFLLETEAIKKLLPKYMRRVLEILYIGTVLLSSSRAGLVALIACYALYFLVKRKGIFLLSIPFIALASNKVLEMIEQLLGQSMESTSYRQYIIKQALLLWNNNKFLGNGGNAITFLSSNEQINTMNTYVFMLLCYGGIGLAFYIGFIVLLIKNDIIQWIKNKKSSPDCILKISAIASMCIIAYSLDTFYMALIWILPAIFNALDSCIYNKINVGVEDK